MMGGDLDASSKCIAGIHIVDNDAYLLVVVSIWMRSCLRHNFVHIFFQLNETISKNIESGI